MGKNVVNAVGNDLTKLAMHQLQVARDTACQMELATYEGEHTVQAAGLVKDVEIAAKWALTDATLPRCNKYECSLIA